MAFYEVPTSIQGEIDKFASDIDGYRKGDISGVQFKGLRVAHGLYEQRKTNTHMMRIRCAGGGVTPAQLKRVAELSKEYGAAEFHVTTRQELQFHYVDLEDVATVYRELVKVGLSSRGGGGNTIRNIMSDWDSGIRKDEVFDVAPYAMELTSRMIAEEDSWNLPRKFKIAFSNHPDDNINATITCLGFIAMIKDGKQGFRVYCSGGMGAKPMPGKVLYDFVEADRVYYVVKAAKNMFDKHGNRRRRTMSRFKFLWEKLGEEEFRRIFDEEYAAAQADAANKPLNIVDANNVAQVKEGYAPEAPLYQEGFETWMNRNVEEQKQDGLFTVSIPLYLGDIRNEDGIRMAEVLANFGENCIRLSILQNVHLRNIPKDYLGNIYNLICEIETQSAGPKMLGSMVSCTGAATCKLGLCLPRGVTPEIQNRLLNSELDLEQVSDVKIHISGCPNTCGRHHAADLGFFGKAGRKGKEMYPAYNIMAGAVIKDGHVQFAKKVDEIPAKDVPEFVHDLFDMYLTKKTNYDSFTAYIEDCGTEDIKTLAAKFNSSVPEFTQDEGYFYDWGDGEKFSLLKGQKAECAAGVFDMIDVDVKYLKENKKAIEAGDIAAGDLNEVLYQMVFHAGRMLLVTRGVEAKSEAQVFRSFEEYFIAADLVDKKFLPLVEDAREKRLDAIAGKQAEVFELADAMQKLYASMDDSLRFNVGTVKSDAPEAAAAPAEAAPAPAEAAPAAESADDDSSAPDATKDFRGVACPMNFVKTKIALEPMNRGQLLEVLLDDGAPIQNVPRSIMNEGHKVLKQEQVDDAHWSVLIEKV